MYGHNHHGAQHRQDDESIYSLISRPEAAEARPPMYRSRYPPTAPPTASTFRRGPTSQAMVSNIAGEYEDTASHTRKHALFGPHNPELPDPNRYLKKGTRMLAVQQAAAKSSLKPFHYDDRRKEPITPTTPAEQEVVAMSATGSRRPRNFIAENTMRAVKMQPPAPVVAEKDVDYTKKATFGKVPAYLSGVKSDIAREKEYITQVMAARAGAQHAATARQTQVAPMPEEERQALLAALKIKWEEVNAQYQRTTHVVNLDTAGKIRRKEECEQQLQQLEKSIEKLSKKNVYVAQEEYSYQQAY